MVSNGFEAEHGVKGVEHGGDEERSTNLPDLPGLAGVTDSTVSMLRRLTSRLRPPMAAGSFPALV